MLEGVVSQYANSQVHSWAVLDKLANHDPSVTSLQQLASVYNGMGGEWLDLSYSNERKLAEYLTAKGNRSEKTSDYI